jgi:hypothetical protein
LLSNPPLAYCHYSIQYKHCLFFAIRPLLKLLILSYGSIQYLDCLPILFMLIWLVLSHHWLQLGL